MEPIGYFPRKRSITRYFSFTSSQLFYCINERMNMKRSTIISTNLSLAMLRDSYTDRVTSRIMSGYTIIPLYGGDIRLLKS